MKFQKILLIIPATLLLLTACGGENPAEDEKVARESATPVKEVSIFDLSGSDANLEFSKTGTAEAEGIVEVSAEISGRIVDINAEVGQTIKSGSNLITLGNSLNTNILDVQYNTAQQATDIAQESEIYTNYIAENNVESAEIAVLQAKNAYTNSIRTLENTQSVYREQRRSAQISLDNAEINYDQADDLVDELEEDLDDLEDDLEDAEDELDEVLDNLDDNPGNPALLARKKELENTIDSLESSIDSTEDTLDSAETQADIAKNSVEQAQSAVAQLDKNFKSQQDNLQFSIANAYSQYEAAIITLENAYASGENQKLGAESSVLQSASSEEISRLNSQSRYVKAPISGTITEVSAEEGNLITPGQTLIRIENSDNIIVKTSVNEFEAGLLRKGDKVEISTDSGKLAKGEILTIAGSADPVSKKIQIEIIVKDRNKVTPESFVKVYFYPETNKRIFIPLNAIITDSGKKEVRIMNSKNEVVLREVEIGNIIGNSIEITKGLKGNEKVIISRNLFLEEGEKVKPLDE